MHVSRTSAHSTSQVLLASALLSLTTLPAALAKGSTFVSLSSSAPKTLDALISQYGLNQTFSFDQPSRDLSASSAASYLKENWNLNSNKVQAGAEFISFSEDPFDSSDSSTVLEVDYEKGSFGGSGEGGAQFYAQPLNGSNAPLSSMLLQYDVAFSDGYSFSQGGKLPGLRGGPSPAGCTGGNEADGVSCFTTRLMWRASGAGEVYAYIPTTGYGLCSASDVICNSDYGTSLSRGSFTLRSGQWNPLSLFVQLNNPPTTANGRVFLYYNGTLALAHDNLQLRASTDIESIGGLFFSTFFGGADVSWASPQNQSTFYRNFKLLGGTGVSDGSGKTVGSAGWRQSSVSTGAVALGVVAFGAIFLF